MFSCRSPYIKNQFTVRKYNENIYRIVYHASLRESGWYDNRLDHKEDHYNRVRGECNDGKTSQSLSRSRSRIYELALCNKWDRFITLTLDPKKVNDVFDLDAIYKEISKFFNNFGKYRPDFAYLLVPEKHKSGAWHFHGLIRGLKESDLRINENGFLEWKQFAKKFGFTSIDKDPIKSPEAVAAYITKYITKDLLKSVSEMNAHCYYCSKGLKRSEIVYRGSAEYIGKEWDYAPHDGYVKVKTVDTRKESLDDYLIIPDYSGASCDDACDTFESDSFASDSSFEIKEDVEASECGEFIYMGIDESGIMTFVNPETGEVYETPVEFEEDNGG